MHSCRGRLRGFVVALRKESVDRNLQNCCPYLSSLTSLSARRAWIEIFITVTRTPIGCVALRKESVDRNSRGRDCGQYGRQSLSARRAWIEIWGNYIVVKMSDVALRKESVDRNTIWECMSKSIAMVALRKESVDRNRSTHNTSIYTCSSLSARRAWIEIMTHTQKFCA